MSNSLKYHLHHPDLPAQPCVAHEDADDADDDDYDDDADDPHHADDQAQQPGVAHEDADDDDDDDDADDDDDGKPQQQLAAVWRTTKLWHYHHLRLQLQPNPI